MGEVKNLWLKGCLYLLGGAVSGISLLLDAIDGGRSS
jgi:hypothetical protein